MSAASRTRELLDLLQPEPNAANPARLLVHIKTR